MTSSLSRFIRPFTEEGQNAKALADLYGFTVAELRERCHPDEWQEIEHNVEALTQLARSLRESIQIEQGEQPERFTAVATCARCGEVWVPAFLAGKRMIGCRWCEPRERGIAIPHP